MLTCICYFTIKLQYGLLMLYGSSLALLVVWIVRSVLEMFLEIDNKEFFSSFLAIPKNKKLFVIWNLPNKWSFLTKFPCLIVFFSLFYSKYKPTLTKYGI